MKLSISSASLWPYPLFRQFGAIARAGATHVELVVNPEAAYLGAGYIQRLASRHGLTVTSVHTPLWRLPGWMSLKAQVRGSFRLATLLGAGVVVLHGPPAEGASKQVPDSYHRLIDEARRWKATGHAAGGPVLALENGTGLRHLARRGQEARPHYERYLEFVEHHDLAATFDTAHAYLAGEDIWEQYQRVAHRVVNIHLSDVLPQSRLRQAPLLSTHFSQHRLPGEGLAALGDFLRRLGESGYDGLLTLEVGPLALGLWRPWRTVPRLRQALAFCQQHLGTA